jgi:hypothetical protein
MLLNLFKKHCLFRRFSPQILVNGYAQSGGYNDTSVLMNIQPLNANDLLSLPEGERTVKRIKAVSSTIFQAANQENSTPGDILFYNGEWYECKSAIIWQEHTPLEHCSSQWVLIANQDNIPQSELSI